MNAKEIGTKGHRLHPPPCLRVKFSGDTPAGQMKDSDPNAMKAVKVT